MARAAKEPLRTLTQEEQQGLEELSRARSAPMVQVTRARLLLRVATGENYSAAARAEGRRSGDAVGQLVARFNRAGLTALEPQHGGGARTIYGLAERSRILAELKRQPDREKDGTATWSIGTLQRALRQGPDGLPGVSRETLWKVVHEAGYTWQKDRSWCQTGKVLRKRKSGTVEVTDPDAEAKKR
jgi:transposase